MKKLLLMLLVLLIGCIVTEGVFASSDMVINKLNDGTKLKCTGIKTKGSIPEYNNEVVDYYIVKNNGRIYADNLNSLYKTPKLKKVGNLKITEDKITFKDRIYGFKLNNYKWVTIDRRTGAYSFKAIKKYAWAWYQQTGYINGSCTVIE